jgi:hypothetical protein
MCWSLSLPDPVDSFTDLDFGLIAPAASSFSLLLSSLFSFSVIQQGQILQVKKRLGQCQANPKQQAAGRLQECTKYSHHSLVQCRSSRKWLYDSELLKRGLEICFMNEVFGDLFFFTNRTKKNSSVAGILELLLKAHELGFIEVSPHFI